MLDFTIYGLNINIRYKQGKRKGEEERRRQAKGKERDREGRRGEKRGYIWQVRYTHSLRLPGKKRQKMQIWPSFQIGRLLYPSPFTIMTKFGMQEKTHSVLIHTRFHINQCIFYTYNHTNLTNFWIFGWLVYPPRSSIWTTSGRREHTHAKFHPDRFTVLPLRGKNPKFYCIFNFHTMWWRHLAMQRQSWTQLDNYKRSPIQRHQDRLSLQRA